MEDAISRDDVDLYDRDFYAWTQRQVSILRSGSLGALDVTNVLEEIESLGRSQINALLSRYSILCLHLLKLIVQPERRSRSWTLTIVEQRIQIARLFATNPGLKSKRAALFQEAYEDGRKLCAAETGLDIGAIPHEPPFGVDQAEDEAWLPSAF